jgi:hypothetical protein
MKCAAAREKDNFCIVPVNNPHGCAHYDYGRCGLEKSKKEREYTEKKGGKFMGKKLQKKSTAHLIILQTTPRVAIVADWLHAHLSEHEELNIYHWHKSYFYLEVKDTREGWEPVSNMRCWFTVDLKKDVILWNDNFPQRGNCGVRTNKWKSLLLKTFGLKRKACVHWYKNRYLKGERP